MNKIMEHEMNIGILQQFTGLGTGLGPTAGGEN